MNIASGATGAVGAGGRLLRMRDGCGCGGRSAGVRGVVARRLAQRSGDP